MANGICVSECPDGTYANTQYQCITCPPNCATCITAKRCTSCSADHALNVTAELLPTTCKRFCTATKRPAPCDDCDLPYTLVTYWSPSVTAANVTAVCQAPYPTDDLLDDDDAPEPTTQAPELAATTEASTFHKNNAGVIAISTIAGVIGLAAIAIAIVIVVRTKNNSDGGYSSIAWPSSRS
jgi:hypothetical protein